LSNFGNDNLTARRSPSRDGFTDQERGELVTAIEAMVGKLDGFVTQHKNGIEVATVFMEVAGSTMDHFFLSSNNPSSRSQQISNVMDTFVHAVKLCALHFSCSRRWEFSSDFAGKAFKEKC
jgi:hypothetical protein